MIALENILCPIDFSDPSLTATQYALEFAKTFGARLHLLHVIEDPILYSPAFGGYAPNPEDTEAWANTALENWIAPEDAGDVEIERRWLHGSPFVGIIQEAKKRNADLIVIGTHGRGFLAHILLGSVAERVVREAPCPVLTVRPEDFRYEPIAASPESGE